jgi:hypothetical protein
LIPQTAAMLGGQPSWDTSVHPLDPPAVVAKLRALGVELEGPRATEYGTEECLCHDPDGYELWISWPKTT